MFNNTIQRSSAVPLMNRMKWSSMLYLRYRVVHMLIHRFQPDAPRDWRSLVLLALKFLPVLVDGLMDAFHDRTGDQHRGELKHTLLHMDVGMRNFLQDIFELPPCVSHTHVVTGGAGYLQDALAIESLQFTIDRGYVPML